MRYVTLGRAALPGEQLAAFRLANVVIGNPAPCTREKRA